MVQCSVMQCGVMSTIWHVGEAGYQARGRGGGVQEVGWGAGGGVQGPDVPLRLRL